MINTVTITQAGRKLESDSQCFVTIIVTIAANIPKGSMTMGTAYKSMKVVGSDQKDGGMALRNTAKTHLLMSLPDMLVKAVWHLGKKRSSYLVLTPFEPYL